MSRLAVWVASFLLCACSTPPAPVIDRSSTSGIQAASINGTYKIKSGDTLHAIAFRFGLDHRELARWNDINAPYLIYPEQVLRLTKRPASIARNSPATRTASVSKPSARPPAVKSVPATPPAQTSQAATKKLNSTSPASWVWPVKGRVLRGFLANDPARNGLDITAVEGQDVVASAAGTVVYSGSGLIGYGELIIVKHSEVMLSAYAHNRVRLVDEGSKVNQGQKIAELGRNDRNEPILHFEIRVSGRPVDPRKYLPNR